MRYKVEYMYTGTSAPDTPGVWYQWHGGSYQHPQFNPDRTRHHTFPSFLEANVWAEYAQAERVRLGRQQSTPIAFRVVEAENVQ